MDRFLERHNLPNLHKKIIDNLNRFMSISSADEESACNAGNRFDSWVKKFPWRRDRLPIPVFSGFPGDSDGKESASAHFLGFPVAQMVKNLPAMPQTWAWSLGSIPGLGRSLEGGHGNPLQYSCLENPMDRGAWWATVHGVAKSRTWPSDFHFTSSCLLKKLNQFWCLPKQNASDPDEFTAEFHQTLSEQIRLTLYNIFHNLLKGILPNPSYEVSIALISKPKTLRERKLPTNYLSWT